MNTTSGNIVDLILKASMLRKSFDNVTCLFISFKDFFDNSQKNEISKKQGLKDVLLRNKSNFENIENIKKNDLIRFNKEIINSKANLSAQNFFSKDTKDDIFTKNKLNLDDDDNKVERNKLRILTLPKQNINLKLNNKDEDKNNNCDNDNKKILTKNKTEVNLISNIKNKNDEIFKGKENMERSNSFSNNLIENNLENIKYNNLTTNINSPIIKDKIKRKAFTNPIFFSNTQIIDINRNRKKNNNKLKINNRIILNNKKEEDLRHSSYNKKIKELNNNNSDKLGLKLKNSNIKFPKYDLLVNNRKLNMKKIKEDNFISNDKKKLNKIKLENNKISNSYKNIKSNNTKIHKIKDKLEFKKFYNNNNIKIKFNHIIKSKKNNVKKKENEMPSLTDNLNDVNIKRENKFLKRNYSNSRKKLTYSEQKKVMNGEYRINLNLSNKNIFGNYKNIYYKSKKDNNGFYNDNRRKESNSSKYEK